MYINLIPGRSRILSETSSSHATLAALPPTGRSRAQSAPSFRAMMERQVGQGLQQISDQFERENRMVSDFRNMYIALYLGEPVPEEKITSFLYKNIRCIIFGELQYYLSKANFYKNHSSSNHY